MVITTVINVIMIPTSTFGSVSRFTTVQSRAFIH